MEQSELNEIARKLRLAVAISPQSPVDLAMWYERSAALLKELQAQFPDFELPHEVHHYFADGDIRAKDADYRAQQHAMMLEAIGRVERGDTG